MSLVVDASVALKWVLAGCLEDLIAPSLWLLEAANALWRRAKRGELSADEAAEHLSELFNAPVTAIPIEEDLQAAARLAQRLGHPVYDCLYLALAMRERTQVVTADRRFWTVVQNAADLAHSVRLLEA